MGVEPDYSNLAKHQSYNTELTKMRDLDRYRTGYSDRTNIFDQARVVSPLNYFGIKTGRYIDPTTRYFPAGFDMTNSRPITGVSFTKPIVRRFQPI
jgi:hypothetical protein